MRLKNPFPAVALLALFGVVTLSQNVRAQEAAASTVAPPSGAPVRPMPSAVHWVLSFQYSNAALVDGNPAEAPKNRLKQIEVTKSGDMRRDIVSFADGTTRQFDRKDPYVFVVGQEGVEIVMPLASQPLYPFYSEKYPLLDWVEAQHFVDRSKRRGVLCYHYKNGTQEAWIAVDTNLPFAATTPDGGEAVYRFFDTPGPIKLTLAEEERLARQLKSMKALDAVR